MGLFVGLGCGGMVVVLVAVVALIGFPWGMSAGGRSSAIFDASSGFKPGVSITEEELAKTDSESIFWTVFRNQMRQRYLQINKQFFGDRRDYEEGTGVSSDDVRQSRIDFARQRITAGSTYYERDDSGRLVVDYEARCIGDVEYNNNINDTWEKRNSGIKCMKSGLNIEAGDGIAPGGLSDGQADDYISYIQNRYEDNPVSVGKAELVHHKGGKYVKLPMKVTPVYTGTGYSGMMIFLWGTNEIDRPAVTHLYADFGSGASGAELTYYIDPKTSLPAYMTMQETPGLNKDGSVINDPEGSRSFMRIQYAYPNEWRPYSLDGHDVQPITMDWEKTLP